MASRNISKYDNLNSNQNYTFISVKCENYDYSGSTNSYVVTYEGYVIDISMLRILSNGYCQVKYTIQNIASNRDYNYYLFTYRSYYNSYTTREVKIDLGVETEQLCSYTLSNQNYFNAIDLNFEFYNTADSIGWTNGYTEGFDDAQDLFETENQDFNGTFTLIGSAFNSLSGILETQVIGGLTIGALIGIPLTITILVTIFRIMRK